MNILRPNTTRSLVSFASVSTNIRLVFGRCLSTLPILLLVSLLTFLFVNILPGNVAQQLAGIEATPEQVARLEVELGLDRPPWERYWHGLTGFAKGDFGSSAASGQPVVTMLAERLPVTFELVALALGAAVTVAALFSVFSARRPLGVADRLTMFLSMTGLSLASYVLGPVLIFIFAVQLRALPSLGFVPLGEHAFEHFRALLLPTITVAIPLCALSTRFLRSDLVEQLDQEYVLSARAKGLSEWRILFRHALPNSLIGLLNIIGLNIGALLSGAVIVEQIFAVPGIGQLLIQSLVLRDVAVVQAIVLTLAVVTVLSNLIVDLVCGALDPRMRYGSR